MKTEQQELTRIALPHQSGYKPGRYLEIMPLSRKWRLCEPDGSTAGFLADEVCRYISAAHQPRALILDANQRAERYAARILELEALNLASITKNITLAREKEEAQERVAELEGVVALEAKRLRRATRVIQHGTLADMAQRSWRRIFTAAAIAAAFLAGAAWAGSLPQ